MIDENKLIERIEEAFYDEKYINRSAYCKKCGFHFGVVECREE